MESSWPQPWGAWGRRALSIAFPYSPWVMSCLLEQGHDPSGIPDGCLHQRPLELKGEQEGCNIPMAFLRGGQSGGSVLPDEPPGQRLKPISGPPRQQPPLWWSRHLFSPVAAAIGVHVPLRRRASDLAAHLSFPKISCWPRVGGPHCHALLSLERLWVTL